MWPPLENKKIYIGELTDLDEKDILEKLSKLKKLTEDEKTKIEEIKKTIKEVVPTYIIKNEEKIKEETIEEKTKTKKTIEVIKKLAIDPKTQTANI